MDRDKNGQKGTGWTLRLWTGWTGSPRLTDYRRIGRTQMDALDGTEERVVARNLIPHC